MDIVTQFPDWTNWEKDTVAGGLEAAPWKFILSVGCVVRVEWKKSERQTGESEREERETDRQERERKRERERRERGRE